MDWKDIEAKLQERVEDVCRHLLPNGHREGGEWVCGSLNGEEGRSLKVNLAGKLGIWKDFAGEHGGKTLLSLWLLARSLPRFGNAMGEAKKWLGVPDDFERRIQKPELNRRGAEAPSGNQPEDSGWKAVADTWAKCEPLTEGGPVWHYLVEQRRLDPFALEAFQVREFLSHGKWVIVFPYFAAPAESDTATVPTGKPLPEWLKFEALERLEVLKDGVPTGKKKKSEWTSRAPEKSLFGVQLSEHTLFKRCNHVLICEGEKDALTWASYGCATWSILPVSVPFGAKWKTKPAGKEELGRPSPNREWLDRNWDWLQTFETVFVQMDADEPGQRAAIDIINEIGPRRCRLVSLPEKEQAA